MARGLLAAITALALTAAPAWAQRAPVPALDPPPVRATMDDGEIGAAMEAWLGGLAGQRGFSGAVLLARDGREIYVGGFGPTDIASGAAIDADTRFPLASIGKAFTHVAIAQLVQQGRLSLQSTLGELIPDYPNSVSGAATIEQLLNHRAGVADIFGPAFRALPKEQLASNHDYFLLVSAQPALFAPGAREEYCNGCYVVLGEIVARISGQSYEDYVAEHVFAAAGMTRSGFWRRDQLPSNAASFTGRPQGPDGPLVDVSRFHGVAGSAAGNCYSTVRDLLAFDAALREHRLLSPELTAQVLRASPQTGRSNARIGFAGGGPGVSTLLNGNGAWTLIVLANREPPIAEAIGQAVFPLLAGPREP